ncbi:4Fe-4S binding protein [candidate division KSB1 bacterium]|nr:4Fe-4S binding protein [candidate division KSB1 bacterium]
MITKRLRLLLQILILVLIGFVMLKGLDVEAYCPFGGFLAFSTQIYKNTLACNMSSTAIFMGLALAIAALGIGKLFCGYVCPLGTISEWLGVVGQRARWQVVMPAALDRIFRFTKYLLLFIVAYKTITVSELFCRKFDPYYALSSGFGHDVVIAWAIPAITVLLIGALVIKHFWCRYVCPLGAITNLLANVYLIFIPLLIFVGVKQVWPEFSVMWLLISVSSIGYLWEIGFNNLAPLPLTKITINPEKCTACSRCNKACPAAIDVRSSLKVDHPDCTLCTLCIHSCPESGAISINNHRVRTWVPLVAVVLLPLMGFVASTQYEFRTLEMRWGINNNNEHIERFQQSGLDNIRCYGTSMALYQRLREIPGICGLDTYAKSHRVSIYYQPDEIKAFDIKQILFNPQKLRLRALTDSNLSCISAWKTGVEPLFNARDHQLFAELLKSNPAILGFESKFDEPVWATIYFESDKITSDQIRALIDTSRTVTLISDENDNLIHVDFQCIDGTDTVDVMSAHDYRQRMFAAFDRTFNSYELRNEDFLKVIKVEFPDAEKSGMISELSVFADTLSQYQGIVRLQTMLGERVPLLMIHYDVRQIRESDIMGIMEDYDWKLNIGKSISTILQDKNQSKN